MKQVIVCAIGSRPAADPDVILDMSEHLVERILSIDFPISAACGGVSYICVIRCSHANPLKCSPHRFSCSIPQEQNSAKVGFMLQGVRWPTELLRFGNPSPLIG